MNEVDRIAISHLEVLPGLKMRTRLDVLPEFRSVPDNRWVAGSSSRLAPNNTAAQYDVFAWFRIDKRSQLLSRFTKAQALVANHEQLDFQRV
jgi:hypothetical protein